MSLAEMKENLARLTPKEREELGQFLRAQQLIESPDYRTRVERADREIDAGNFITLGQLKEAIAKNQASRRPS